jgi:hypothetical protein
MAGTVTVTRLPKAMAQSGKKVDVVKIDWVADAADGSVPNTSITGLWGFLLKAITNPGSTAPTANYDIELLDPEDATCDALGATLNNRHTTSTEMVYPVISGAAVPIFLCGDYTFKLSNNSVNSATGSVILFLVESL